MPYYKDLKQGLHFLDSSEFEYLLPEGCVSITELEVAAIQEQQALEVLATAPIPPTAAELMAQLASIQAQIEVLA